MGLEEQIAVVQATRTEVVLNTPPNCRTVEKTVSTVSCERCCSWKTCCDFVCSRRRLHHAGPSSRSIRVKSIQTFTLQPPSAILLRCSVCCTVVFTLSLNADLIRRRAITNASSSTTVVIFEKEETISMAVACVVLFLRGAQVLIFQYGFSL